MYLDQQDSLLGLKVKGSYRVNAAAFVRKDTLIKLDYIYRMLCVILMDLRLDSVKSIKSMHVDVYIKI